MQLLYFAHRGEAQAFISALKLKADQKIDQLYSSEKFKLFIGGEGLENAMIKVSALLGKFPEISAVINLGIAGGLNSKLELEHIYSIRTIYAHGADIHFQSYTSAHNTGLDCISSSERVLTDEYAKTLSHFADLVDRELWGMARACHYHKIPWHSYKLISDIAGNQTQCFDLKQRALYFSEMLYHFFSKNIQNEIEHYPEVEIDVYKNLHLSFTQTKLLDKLLLKISHKEELDKKVILAEELALLEEIKLERKQKNTLLLQKLEFRLNPLKQKVYHAIQKANSPLTNAGAKVIYDQQLEKKSFQIHLDINDQKNLIDLSQALNQTNFQDFLNIMNGDLDV